MNSSNIVRSSSNSNSIVGAFTVVVGAFTVVGWTLGAVVA
jgi:hypothetical protein